ncbi:hypothetical protein OBBRIDRAFT_836011 [Obba rivulosa]|uniref:Uncharacterized protein n=1 Tax=Obba rivulosa TaxID=1052685 RepID=A0A8E2ARR5_9APHY|nr:hypothetical protein OBBRIDRAFT_836011 [Obba rivulosa]
MSYFEYQGDSSYDPSSSTPGLATTDDYTQNEPSAQTFYASQQQNGFVDMEQQPTYEQYYNHAFQQQMGFADMEQQPTQEQYYGYYNHVDASIPDGSHSMAPFRVPNEDLQFPHPHILHDVLSDAWSAPSYSVASSLEEGPLLMPEAPFNSATEWEGVSRFSDMLPPDAYQTSTYLVSYPVAAPSLPLTAATDVGAPFTLPDYSSLPDDGVLPPTAADGGFPDDDSMGYHAFDHMFPTPSPSGPSTLPNISSTSSLSGALDLIFGGEGTQSSIADWDAEPLHASISALLEDVDIQSPPRSWPDSISDNGNDDLAMSGPLTPLASSPEPEESSVSVTLRRSPRKKKAAPLRVPQPISSMPSLLKSLPSKHDSISAPVAGVKTRTAYAQSISAVAPFKSASKREAAGRRSLRRSARKLR